MRPPRSRVWLVLAALFLAGCGGDDDDATTTVPETTTPAPDTTAAGEGTTPEPAGAEAEAQAAVLQPGDLPAGWETKPEEERVDHETTWQALLACGGINPTEGVAANASSPTYLTGMGTQVTAAVSYYDSSDRVAALAEAFSGEDFSACAEAALLDELERNAPPDATLSDVSITSVEAPELGQKTISYRTNGMLDVGPLTISVFHDFVAVFDEDAVSRVNFLNSGTPFAEDFRQSLVETVVNRA